MPELGDGDKIIKEYVRDGRIGGEKDAISRWGDFNAERASNFHWGRVALAAVLGGCTFGGLFLILNNTLIEQDRIVNAPLVDLQSFKDQLRTNPAAKVFYKEGVAVSSRYVQLQGYATYAGETNWYSTNYGRQMVSYTYRFTPGVEESTNATDSGQAAPNTNDIPVLLRIKQPADRVSVNEEVLSPHSVNTKVAVIVGTSSRALKISTNFLLLNPVLVESADK